MDHSKFVSKQDVEKARKAIKNQSEDRATLSLSQAIELMHEDIEKMLANGHKWKVVHATLYRSGLKIQLTTLRSYFYKLTNEKKKSPVNPIQVGTEL